MTESPNSLNRVPFVGREDIFAKIHQHVVDAQSPRALTILGGHGMGKTALLQHWLNSMDDLTIGIYIPLKSTPVQTETALWLQLMERIHQVMATRTYMEGRLPSPNAEILHDELLFWAWFQDRFIVTLLRIIRPHRRLVWLFDDFHLLEDHLPAEQAQIFADHLSELLNLSGQLLMATTLPLSQEELLVKYRTIVQESAAAIRLPYFTQAEVRQCIVAFLPNAPVDEPTVNTLHTLTGGHPWLLTDYLRDVRNAQSTPPFKDIQATMKALQTQHDAFFQQIWHTLNDHEHTILHAIADLHNQQDETVIHFSVLEKWLLESDLALERTMVRATIRSLEYQQVITQTSGGYWMVVRLFQAWIIRQRPAPLKRPASYKVRNRLMWVLAGVGMITVLLWLVIRVQQTPRTGVEFIRPAATVTLEN